MRNLLIVLVAALVALSACAAPVVQWDAVIESVEGSPILPGEATYCVYWRFPGQGEATLYGETAELEMELSFGDRLEREVGVSCVVGGAESDVAWSSDPAVCAEGVVFVVRMDFWGKPKWPLRLREG